jgi:hypothetical protein
MMRKLGQIWIRLPHRMIERLNGRSPVRIVSCPTSDRFVGRFGNVTNAV